MEEDHKIGLWGRVCKGWTSIAKHHHDEGDCYELPKKHRVVSQINKENINFMAEFGA